MKSAPLRTIPLASRLLPRAARGAILAGTALGASWTAAALAQNSTGTAPSVQPRRSGSLAEVVVTAERRRATAQKTAASVSVRSGQDLLKNGQYSLSQILEDVPGVATTAAPSVGSDLAGSNITIRGVTSSAVPAGQILPGVPTTAVYVDGIYEGVGSSYDIARVEVLRGPQGTLYGRSATSGVVATYTRDPVLGKLNGFEAVEIGTKGLVHYTGAVNVPLVGNVLALRVSGNHYQEHGYVSASGGAYSNDDWRAKLLYQPTPDFSALFAASGEFNVTHSGGTTVTVPYGHPSGYEYTNGLQIGTGHDHFRQYWANFNWNLGPATLTYIPAVRSWHQDGVLYQAAGGPLIIQQTEFTPYDQFVTQELRLASNAEAPLTWQTGAFYYNNKVKDANTIRWASSGALVNQAVATRLTEDAGVFLESTYRVAPKLRFTGGLRLDYTRVATSEDFTSNLNNGVTGIPGTASFSLPEDDVTGVLSGSAGIRQWRNITYKARAEYDLAPSKLLYGQVSSGYLPGNVEVAASSSNVPESHSYSEETLTAYEVGSKNRFLGGTLQVNGDLYYNDYSGYQTSINISQSVTTLDLVTVGVPAHIKGGELEILYRLTPDDTLGLNASYSYGSYANRPAIFLKYVQQEQVLGVPPVTVDPSFAHNILLADASSIVLHADAEFSSAYDENAITPQVAEDGGEDYVHLGAQVIGNVNASWTSANGKYTVTLYVRNISDDRYKTGANISAVASGANATPYQPRIFGGIEQISF